MLPVNNDTLFSKVNGVVRFERKGRDKRQVSVYPVAEAALNSNNEGIRCPFLLQL